MTLYHNTNDIVSRRIGSGCGQLLGNVLCDERLAFVVLFRVSMRAVNHDEWLQTGLLDLISVFADVLIGVIWTVVSSAQNDVTRIVAGGGYDSAKTLFCDREEVVTDGSGAYGVYGNADISVRS